MTNILLLDALSGVFLIAAIVLSFVVAFDMKARPQSMKIMGWVWFLTILWSSLLGFIAYYIFGREKKPDTKKMDNMHSETGVSPDEETDKSGMSPGEDASKSSMGDMPMDMKMDGMDMSGMSTGEDASKSSMGDMSMRMKMEGMDMSGMSSGKDAPKSSMGDMPMSMKMDGMDMSMPMTKRPKWQSIALSAMHCGAGCTLADIIGESYTGFHPIAIGGSFVIGAWVIDYILALIIGVYFQYVAIREMQKISAGEALLRAIKADFLSLTSWQIGMYGWMYVVIFILFKDQPLSKTSTEFWFMMQIAMLCGFITAYPMNALLIKLGIKKGM